MDTFCVLVLIPVSSCNGLEPKILTINLVLSIISGVVGLVTFLFLAAYLKRATSFEFLLPIFGILSLIATTIDFIGRSNPTKFDQFMLLDRFGSIFGILSLCTLLIYFVLMARRLHYACFNQRIAILGTTIFIFLSIIIIILTTVSQSLITYNRSTSSVGFSSTDATPTSTTAATAKEFIILNQVIIGLYSTLIGFLLLSCLYVIIKEPEEIKDLGIVIVSLVLFVVQGALGTTGQADRLMVRRGMIYGGFGTFCLGAVWRNRSPTGPFIFSSSKITRNPKLPAFEIMSTTKPPHISLLSTTGGGTDRPSSWSGIFRSLGNDIDQNGDEEKRDGEEVSKLARGASRRNNFSNERRDSLYQQGQPRLGPNNGYLDPTGRRRTNSYYYNNRGSIPSGPVSSIASDLTRNFPIPPSALTKNDRRRASNQSLEEEGSIAQFARMPPNPSSNPNYSDTSSISPTHSVSTVSQGIVRKASLATRSNSFKLDTMRSVSSLRRPSRNRERTNGPSPEEGTSSSFSFPPPPAEMSQTSLFSAIASRSDHSRPNEKPKPTAAISSSPPPPLPGGKTNNDEALDSPVSIDSHHDQPLPPKRHRRPHHYYPYRPNARTSSSSTSNVSLSVSSVSSAESSNIDVGHRFERGARLSAGIVGTGLPGYPRPVWNRTVGGKAI